MHWLFLACVWYVLDTCWNKKVENAVVRIAKWTTLTVDFAIPVKHHLPKVFCHRCFVQLDESVQNKFHICIKKKFILGYGFDTLSPVTWPLTQWPQNQKRFLYCRGRMCGQSLKKRGQYKWCIFRMLRESGTSSFSVSSPVVKPSAALSYLSVRMLDTFTLAGDLASSLYMWQILNIRSAN